MIKLTIIDRIDIFFRKHGFKLMIAAAVVTGVILWILFNCVCLIYLYNV